MRAMRPPSYLQSAVAWSIIPLLSAYPLVALAHARLVRSIPASHAEVTAPPERIELWFSELLEDGFNSVTIVPAAQLAAPGRASLTRGVPTVDHDDRAHLVVSVPRLVFGSYVVEWRVLSRDGHSATGSFAFQIRTPP